MKLLVPPVAKTNGKTNSNISNELLPLEIRSVRDETLRKLVSDDSRHFVFRLQKKNVVKNPALVDAFVRFLRSYVNSEVTSRFLAMFCLRFTDYEVCTSENRQNTCVSDFVFPFFLATCGTLGPMQKAKTTLPDDCRVDHVNSTGAYHCCAMTTS